MAVRITVDVMAIAVAAVGVREEQEHRLLPMARGKKPVVRAADVAAHVYWCTLASFLRVSVHSTRLSYHVVACHLCIAARCGNNHHDHNDNNNKNDTSKCDSKNNNSSL